MVSRSQRSVSLTAQAGTPKLPKEKDLQAYLMVYHKDQDHGLHMAVSEDGYTWTALNDDKPIFDGDTIAVQHGIRDPHIFRGPDGAFYLSMTDLHVFGLRDGKRVVICGNSNNEAKSLSIEIVNSKSSNSKYLNINLAPHSFNTFVEK